MEQNEALAPQYEYLYHSILKAVLSSSDAFNNDAAFYPVDNDGNPQQEQHDSYFFYHWVRSVPGDFQNQFRENLISVRLTPNVWRSSARKGIGNFKAAKKAFECSAQYNYKTIQQHLAGYIEYAKDQKASLHGIKGYEDTVKKLLNEVESRSSSNSNFQKSDTDFGGFDICWENGICKIKEGEGKQNLRIPDHSDSLSLDNPASLLEWQQHLTPFIGRKQKIKLLQQWLDTPPDRSIQLIYGEGGVGKTCLAFHFAEEILGQDWQAGQADSDLAGDWYSGREGLLLIVDYPEDRKTLVAQLIRAVKDMPKTRQKLRVLLLSRNRDFLETITAKAPGLVNRPINLVGLETEEEQWKLMKAVWDRLQDLKVQGTDQATPKNQKSPIPIDITSLLTWQKQQALYSSPLMIIALALYLFENENRGQQVLFDLKEQDIIRYLSKREELRIKKEVEDYKKANNIGENLQSESVCLIKAMAAIVDGLNNGAIRLLVSDLKQHDLDYPPSEVKYLKKLSVWVDKQLPALKPDILAADFLLYCLEEFAENKESEWIFAAIGLTQLENSNVHNQQISDNFSTLGRLIYDAKIRLKRPWPIGALCLGIEDKLAYNGWIAEHLSKNNLEPHLKPLVIHALRICLNETTDPPTEARFQVSLSIFLAATGDNTGGLKAIQRAVEIREKLAEENFAVYGPKLALSLNNLSIRLADTGDKAGGLKAIKRAVEIREALAEENFAVYEPDLVLSLNNLSIRLAGTGDKAGGLKAIKRAVEIREALAEENLAIYGSDLAQSLLNYCVYFKLHIPFLIRTKKIYIQIHGTCFDPWVMTFPTTLNGLLARAEEMHDQDAVKSIESILQEIPKTTSSND